MSVFLCFFLFLQRSIMVWIDPKDDLLLREILLFEPFKLKTYKKECGNAWKIVADNLNQHDSEQFNSDQRALRERFGILKNSRSTERQWYCSRKRRNYRCCGRYNRKN